MDIVYQEHREKKIEKNANVYNQKNKRRAYKTKRKRRKKKYPKMEISKRAPKITWQKRILHVYKCHTHTHTKIYDDCKYIVNSSEKKDGKTVESTKHHYNDVASIRKYRQWIFVQFFHEFYP